MKLMPTFVSPVLKCADDQLILNAESQSVNTTSRRTSNHGIKLLLVMLEKGSCAFRPSKLPIPTVLIMKSVFTAAGPPQRKKKVEAEVETLRLVKMETLIDRTKFGT